MKPVLKICGMREPDNIMSVASLGPDILGFIFYPGSPRYAPGLLDPGIVASLPRHIRKAGVFVNSDYDHIMPFAEKYSLDIIQLHGDEGPDLCGKIRNTGLKVIKAFKISSSADFGSCSDFVGSTDFFLFDTWTGKHGGSGEKFDWGILDSYSHRHPFFLSGGIGPEDAEHIRKINNPGFYGADINSRFEIKPGLKDVDRIRKFIHDLNKYKIL
jgi:phosphoribosylanthranilate isomerase